MDRRTLLKRLGAFVGGALAATVPIARGGIENRRLITMVGGGGGGGSNVPVGSLAGHVGDPIPPGWLLCDGAELWQEDYPDLFAVIGREYGGSVERYSFNLPRMVDYIIKARA